MRIIPMTRWISDIQKQGRRESPLTIKLNKVILQRLHQGTTTVPYWHHTQLLCLVVVVGEENDERSRNDGDDNCKSSKCPSPSGSV